MICNKKGQNSTISVVIAIVLGIALIVFLIWGFSTNWSFFSSTSAAYTGQVNIDSVRQACQIQCDNEQEGEFCTSKKTVTYVKNNKKEESDLSCIEMIEQGIISLTCNIECSGTCSGTPEQVKQNTEGKEMQCSDLTSSKACKAYSGCEWKYNAA